MKPDIIMFPDASLRRMRKNTNITYAGYGVVLLNLANGKYFTISGTLSKDSIVTCEAWAIYQGLRMVEYLRKQGVVPKHIKVAIFSDSKVNIEALTEWIYHNWDLSDYYNWVKRNKDIVKDQDIYRKILKVLGRGHLKVRFVHIHSHVKTSDMVKQIKKSLDADSVHISDDTLKQILKFNELADTLATRESQKLQKIQENEVFKIKLQRRGKKNEHVFV